MNKAILYINGLLLTLTLISGIALTSTTSAESTSANASVVVPAACTFDTTIDAPHTATITPGTFQEGIGTTTFKTICNDAEGFSVYAVGYSNEEYGNTKLLATVGGQLSPSNDINTGTAASGDTSAWSMKLNPVSGASTPTIENGYDNYKEVPDIYTKVASYASATDSVSGASVQSTYKAFISGTQPAGTYAGKVKYTMVHPASEKPKDDPKFIANLDTGLNINIKMKNLANNITDADEWTEDTMITTITKADSLPTGFTPSEANTITSSTSAQPVYIFFDDTTGTMYYYTEASDIKMNQNSSYFFRDMRALSNLSTISSWNTSNVTNMSYMFHYAGRNATTWSIGNLSSWDTSSVTNMFYMFSYAGYSATTFTLDLSSWDTSSVTNMSMMFSYAGYSATTWSIGDLSSWNTSKVTSMYNMFSRAGYNARTFTLNLSSWDTSSVTNMFQMFDSAGYNATTFTLDLSSWNTSKVTNISYMFRFAGNNATTWSIGDLSSWDTSSVTNMSYMFSFAGYNATTFTLDLSSWDTSSVTSMSNMFHLAGSNATTWSVTIPKTNKGSTPITNTTTRLYGNTTSIYVGPPSGKTFTLAN